MAEEEKEIVEEKTRDDGKIQFPIVPLIITCILLTLMIICIIAIVAVKE